MTVELSAPVIGRPTRDGGQSEVARRILAAAAPRFYLEGIRAVSADAVMADAGVTKVTFYRHFPTKDRLVEAYLETVAAAERQAVTRWRTEHPDDPRSVLAAYAAQLEAQLCGDGFRGCPFLNAAAEYPEVTHPVRAVAERHREWLRGVAEELAADLGVADPHSVAAQLVLLRDGAMSTGVGVEPAEVGQALRRAGLAVLHAA
ncbi:TetR/AcrR family transcriptional regulator [Cellulomonas fengjieae]|uniref:TetR/AcrR family transcriptional regulator n=1 Tax=Cellulomonas fengjieae TaxID=2819978 RepID=UPI001AAF4513|nr:TetR/AcrR family transcriptional regulator [Cellulomonas fengjieae]MBO3102531.1 TetR/AcrR family transcriptional regulator [Cellulomonas fengjieae]